MGLKRPGKESELESGRSGGIGEGRHPAVVSELTAVEADLFDAGGLGPLRHRPADRLGGLLVAAEPDAVPHRLSIELADASVRPVESSMTCA